MRNKKVRNTGFKKLFALCALVAAAFVADYDWSGEESPDELAPVDIQEILLKQAIYSGDHDEILHRKRIISESLGDEFYLDYLQDAVMFDAALAGDIDAVRTAIRYGANTDSFTIGGDSLASLMVKAHGLPAFRALKNMNKELRALNMSEIGFGSLVGNDALMYDLLARYNHQADQQQLYGLVKEAVRYGVKLDEIGHSLGRAPVDVAEIARRNNLSEVMLLLQSSGVSEDVLGPYWGHELYEDYLRDVSAPVYEVKAGDFGGDDFKAYSALQGAALNVPNNRVTPTLLIVEWASVGVNETQISYERRMLNHISKVSYSANGVSRALGGADIFGEYDQPLPILAAQIDGLSKSGDDNLARSAGALLDVAGYDYMIVSESVGAAPKPGLGYAEFYKEWHGHTKNSVFSWLDNDYSFVHYLPIGNSYPEHCITVDRQEICVQDNDPVHHNMNAVRVGAVHAAAKTDASPDLKAYVARYSGQAPSFCAYVPEYKGEAIRGTSFSTPAAAAIEQRLADKFARSADLPSGVVHDDIVFALMATAENQGLYNEGASTPISTYTNIAGLDMSGRCGAGLVQPGKAAALLREMVNLTAADPAIEPTEPFLAKAIIDTDDVTKKNGKYYYEVEVPRSGTLMNLRAGIYYWTGKKGAAQIQIGDAAPVTLNVSASGLSTEFRFVGHQFKAGDKVKIITTQKLREPFFGDGALPFLDLKLVQPSSPINWALENLKPLDVM